MTDFEKVCGFKSLHTAFKKSRRGKRGKDSVAKFEANLLEALHLLHVMLTGKTYRMSPYLTFEVYEPKRRTVMSAAFKDKIVHHSICDNVLEERLSKSFILDNYATQRGKGTHFGLDRLEGFMRQYYRLHGMDGWVLKCDISKYFYSIRHDVLKEQLRKFVTDTDTLWLIDLIIDSTESPGIPIGNQTSQWFAVLYLSGLDHFIKEKLGIKYYGRYMDDFFLIHEDREYLQKCRGEIEKRVSELGLSLNNKTNLFPLRNGIDFLGFHTYLTETGKVIRKIRRKSKNNARRRLKRMKGLLVKGGLSFKKVQSSYQSWRGHAQHGNTYHLVRDMDAYFTKLFKECEEKCPKS
ncbi:MAG: RNA-directed DNA polymerase [Oscillospiraceae bacterium]|nr:RNA-directed DNA polymerase [Oscillospiraceae bacterium]